MERQLTVQEALQEFIEKQEYEEKLLNEVSDQAVRMTRPPSPSQKVDNLGQVIDLRSDQSSVKKNAKTKNLFFVCILRYSANINK